MKGPAAVNMNSRNPIFTRGGFQQGAATPDADELRQMYEAPSYQPGTTTRAMTMDDVVVRTAMTLGLLALTAVVAWAIVPAGLLFPAMIGAALVGLGFGLFLSFKHVTNPAAILTYAAVEGVFIGMASKVLGVYVAGDPDVVGQAAFTTMLVAAVMLALYKFEVIKVTPKFVKFMTAAIGGFFAIVMLSFVLSFFGMGFAHGIGPMGLLFAAIGAGLAAFSLLMDFEFVKQGIQQGAPEKEAWFAAFGLTVTLVWLYLEILRIYAIINSGD